MEGVVGDKIDSDGAECEDSWEPGFKGLFLCTQGHSRSLRRVMTCGG